MEENQLTVGEFLNSTWIGSFHQSQGGDDLIVHFNHIAAIEVNIVGHATGSGTAQIEGNLLYLTIHRADGFDQAFACTFTDATRNQLRGLYLHYSYQWRTVATLCTFTSVAS